MRLMIVFGTRPEAIKLAPVIAAARADDRFTVDAVFSGQHADLVPPILQALDVPADVDLGVMRSGQRLDELTARLFKAIGDRVAATCPDVIVGQGDTTTAFVAGMVAFYHRVPFCHVEAGLRTDSVASPFPEEMNRRICSLAASIHCCPTEDAKRNLTAAEGTVAVTGNTVVDALQMVPTAATGGRLVLVTCHRRENQHGGLERIHAAVEQLAEAFSDIVFAWVSHPNYTEQMAGLPDNVSVLPPVGYADSIKLISQAELVLTDSGGITEEAVSLSTPVHILRETTERTEAVEAGSALLVGTTTSHIVKHATDALTSRTELPSTPLLFGDGRAAERILTQCVDYLKTA